jgi:hypothetical protein
LRAFELFISTVADSRVITVCHFLLERILMMKYHHFANRIAGGALLEILLLLLDLSPSMDDDDWPPSRKAAAIKANLELIETKAKRYPQDKVGLIGFSEKAELLYAPRSLTDGLADLRSVLKNPTGDSGTNFTAALELAETCLFRQQAPSRNTFVSRMITELLYGVHEPNEMRTPQNKGTAGTLKRIILLSDGEHNGAGSPVPIASRLKNAGVVIDCIGIGGSAASVDEKLLRQIASRNPDGSIRYCFIGDQQKLLKKYQNLARHIRPV